MNKRYFVLVLAIVFIIVGIVGIVLTNYYFSSYSRSSYSDSTEYSSNGERIYYTGVSKREQISFRGGPAWLRMHGGSCVACHGEDGHGGLQTMMSDEVTPDITYEALTEEEHKEHEEGEEEHPPYDDKLIKRAITQGVNPAGEALDWTMPRWDMSDEDFEDLLKFLKELED